MKTNTTTTNNHDVYSIVTDKMIASLEQGIVPWRKPWKPTKGLDNILASLAKNYVSNKPYSMLNQMLLGWSSEYHLTFKQITELGGKVKSGEKASMVVFFKQYVTEEAKTDETGNPVLDDEGKAVIELRKSWTLRYYNVFALSQTEGCREIANRPVVTDDVTSAEEEDNGLTPDAVAEKVISDYVSREKTLTFNCRISNEAYYMPATDSVVVPKISQYSNVCEYYSVAFHELTHSTLKEYRCNRSVENHNASFGTSKYAKEELVAEMGACFLTNICGLDTTTAFTNSTAYIQSWLKALRNDKKLVVFASSQAEKATNYILGRTATAEA